MYPSWGLVELTKTQIVDKALHPVSVAVSFASWPFLDPPFGNPYFRIDKNINPPLGDVNSIQRLCETGQSIINSNNLLTKNYLNLILQFPNVECDITRIFLVLKTNRFFLF